MLGASGEADEAVQEAWLRLARSDSADLLSRSPVAARKAASRARKRVEAEPTAPDVDLERQREVVDAFFEASREGDFDALVEVLHPEIVLRAEAARPAPRQIT